MCTIAAVQFLQLPTACVLHCILSLFQAVLSTTLLLTVMPLRIVIGECQPQELHSPCGTRSEKESIEETKTLCCNQNDQISIKISQRSSVSV